MQKVKKERRYAIMIFNTLLKPNLQKIFDDLNLYITSLENQLEFYKKMSDHYNKDKEISKLLKENKELKKKLGKQNDFALSDEEEKDITEWIESHLNEFHNSRDNISISSGFSYEFTPTSIGTVGIVKCSCGDEYCFRDIM